MLSDSQVTTTTNNETGAERYVPRLVEPEILLPSQYFDLFAGRSLLEGEKRLMLAVMEDAVSCYQKYAGAVSGRRKRMFDEAAQWIEAEDTGWVFSFESICNTLGIDPVFLRQGLARWKERYMSERSPSPAKFSRVRLRAARRHKIVPLRDRRRRKLPAAA